MGAVGSNGTRDAELQRDRDRSVAEMDALVSNGTRDKELQWGRDRSVAEMSAQPCSTHGRAVASMGPRPIGRGNMADAWTAHGQCVLQWGRDRSVAEITARVGRLRTYWIGFNGAATDRSRKLPPSARAGSGSQSFNGAATDRSRKCNGHRAVPHRSRPASMGPRPIGRGNTQSLRTRGGGRGMLQWGRDRSVAEIPA